LNNSYPIDSTNESISVNVGALSYRGIGGLPSPNRVVRVGEFHRVIDDHHPDLLAGAWWRESPIDCG
jgi:hypothetical protein